MAGLWLTLSKRNLTKQYHWTFLLQHAWQLILSKNIVLNYTFKVSNIFVANTVELNSKSNMNEQKNIYRSSIIIYFLYYNIEMPIFKQIF